MTNKQPVLRVSGLNVTYRTQSDDVLAVRNATFEVAAGQALGLVGESGAGKSSIGMGLMRLLPSAAEITGSIMLEGEDLAAVSDTDFRRRYAWQRIAMVFQ